MAIDGQLSMASDDGIRAVEVRRSARRRQTVAARLLKGTLIVSVPDNLTKAEEAMWVEKMKERFLVRRRRDRLNAGGYLRRRARLMNERYFEGRLKWASITYVTNQKFRWGSCTHGDGTIRISDVVADMPEWVGDYILVHELAHLLVPNHSEDFWDLVSRYPLAERARGYLIAKGLEEG